MKVLLYETGIPPRRDQECFQCQLEFDVTIAVDSAALHKAVMHHAQAEEKQRNHQPSYKQSLCDLEPG